MIQKAAARRELPPLRLQSLQPWMLPMTHSLLPSPIHPMKLTENDESELIQQCPSHPTEVLREVTRLAVLPAVGGLAAEEARKEQNRADGGAFGLAVGRKPPLVSAAKEKDV
uniref:Uncharacterized protein n=1 Tax=Steinernema glaseri TaxID=37863 RepID=A0A1I7Y4H8_9BILA